MLRAALRHLESWARGGVPGPDLAAAGWLEGEYVAELYLLRGDYEAAYAVAADAAITAGFMLADDRPAILAEAAARADSVWSTG